MILNLFLAYSENYMTSLVHLKQSEARITGIYDILLY